MMSYRKLLVLFVSMWGVPMWAAAQESGPIRGIVVEAGTSIRLGSATISNSHTGQSTVSNSLGTFEISATVGDSPTNVLMGYETVHTKVKTLSDILIDIRSTRDRKSSAQEINVAVRVEYMGGR